MRGAHHDVALRALGREVLVDDTQRARVHGHRRHVFAGQVLVGVPAAAHRRVLLGHQAHDLVAEQPAQVQFARRLQPVADDEVDIAGGEVAAVVVVLVQRHQLQAHARGAVFHLRHQRRQEQRVEVVAGRDAEGQRAGRGVEAGAARRTCMRAEQALGLLQHARGRVQQLQGGLGGPHLLAGPHQQRVARQRPQALELRADGGLRAGQPHGGARNAAFGDHGVQDPDEMEVDGVEIGPPHHMNPRIASILASVYTRERTAVPYGSTPSTHRARIHAA